MKYASNGSIWSIYVIFLTVVDSNLYFADSPNDSKCYYIMKHILFYKKYVGNAG